MSAVYMLRAYRKIFFGTATSGLYMSDPAFSHRVPLILLTVVLVLVGCHPGLLLNLMETAWATAKVAGL
jgi:NADH-quinone oxidoreductase subunit M